jgi:hypothetical protein
MAQTAAPTTYKPVWIDLSTADPAAAREFYAKVFGWNVAVNPDPQYGGYALAKIGGKDVAGIGPKMMAEAPTAWSVYLGTSDIAELTARVEGAGGTVIAPPMQVGEQGSMAVFRDPSGAYISGWQPAMMQGGLTDGQTGAFTWAELNARGMDKAVAFYSKALGWTTKTMPMGAGQPPYTQFVAGDLDVAGGMEMSPMVPAEVPSYWMVYFAVADVDASFKKAIDAGGHEILGPQDYPGGRFAIVSDPQGAVFAMRHLTTR